jgi:dihydrolipoamide dehydrogenase
MVMGSLKMEAEVAVIGGGPGGYVAAIRAADLGKEVVLIDERDRLGGVCLIEGCIPSKVLINAVDVAQAMRNASAFGLTCRDIKFDLDKLRSWKESVVDKLTSGVNLLLKKRGIEIIKGRARFTGVKSLAIEGGSVAGVDFKHAIIATGSHARTLPFTEEKEVWTSREALNLPYVPERLVVIGGGYIGMELGLVYAGLGTTVTIVEHSSQLLSGVDSDLVKIMVRHCEQCFDNVLYQSKVVGIEQASQKYVVTIEQDGKQQRLETDRVLTAVGRIPNTDAIGLENTGVKINANGFIEVDEAGRTNVLGIYAIGDVTPGPMLAHKASREAHVVAEVIANQKSAFDNRAIPAAIFTDPEIAWTGLTEREAESKHVKVTIGRFPLSALGRAQTIGRTDGMVKVLSDPDSGLVRGIGIVGPQASELIAEGTLAIEMGATLEDLINTIHPHPTLSESIMEAAEVAAGEAVHILSPKKKQP